MNDAHTHSCPLPLEAIASPALTGTLYGIAFSLYWLCVQSLYPRLSSPGERRRTIFTLTYTSLVMVLITGLFVLSIGVVRLAYSDRVDPGLRLSNYDCLFRTAQPAIVISGVVGTTVQVLTLGIQVGRLSDQVCSAIDSDDRSGARGLFGVGHDMFSS